MARLLGALVLLLTTLGVPAFAVETGSAAWSIHDLVVYEGPGFAYEVVGSIEGEIHLRVDRCAPRWCRVHSGRVAGWVSRDALAFGQVPRGPLTGPRLDYKYGGPGLACLYEGRNYTGDFICLPSGAYRHDLLLYGTDDRYSSVKIEGNVSVTLCRDRNYENYCVRYNESDPRLPRFLDNSVSSLRVH